MCGADLVRGTLEEQLFYFVLLPAAVVVPVSAARWWQDRAVGRVAARGPAPSAARTVAMVLVALWGVAAVTSYVEVHTTRDDAYARMVDYVDTRLRFDGTPRIGVTSDPASVLLKGSEIFRVGTAADARRDRVDFVLVSSSAVRNGTAEVSPSLLRLIEEGSLVHRVRGRSVEELDLYRVATPPG